RMSMSRVPWTTPPVFCAIGIFVSSRLSRGEYPGSLDCQEEIAKRCSRGRLTGLVGHPTCLTSQLNGQISAGFWLIDSLACQFLNVVCSILLALLDKLWDDWVLQRRYQRRPSTPRPRRWRPRRRAPSHTS